MEEVKQSVDTVSEESANTAEPVRKRNFEDKFRDWLRWWPWAHKLFCKYEELWVYLVVGVLTTIVSWVACFLAEHFLLDSTDTVQNAIINTIGWVAGVCFKKLKKVYLKN